MAVSLRTIDEQAASQEASSCLPPRASAQELPIEELDGIYAYLYARVRNRMDAEDLTQQVALKAMPRLKPGAGSSAVRSYLFATARSALATYWSMRLGMPLEELRDDLWFNAAHHMPTQKRASGDQVRRILASLPARYARLLELRFLHGYSLKEAAAELRTTVGAAKALQVRALRAAARVGANA